MSTQLVFFKASVCGSSSVAMVLQQFWAGVVFCCQASRSDVFSQSGLASTPTRWMACCAVLCCGCQQRLRWWWCDV